MKLIMRCISLGLILIQLSSCQKTKPFSPALAGTFFPLRPGLSWTYQLFDKAHNTAAIFKDRTELNDRMGIPITEESRDINRAGSVVSEEFSTMQKSDDILYTVEHGYITRIFSFDRTGETVFKEERFLPRLLMPNLNWSNTVFPFGPGLSAGLQLTQTHHTSLERDVVTVPAGHFSNCIRIDTKAVYGYGGGVMEKLAARQLKFLDWYAPDVGLVKTVIFERGLFDKEIGKVELLRFTNTPRNGMRPEHSSGTR